MAHKARSNNARLERPWQDIAQEAQDYRDASIVDYQADIPHFAGGVPRNVVSIIRNHLSQGEIQITEAPPEELLISLASGNLTAVVVTTAFLRRASLAQQLVCVIDEEVFLCIPICALDELPHRAPPRTSSGSGTIPGRLPCQVQETTWSPSRLAYQCQRAHRYEGTRPQRWLCSVVG